MRVRRKLAYIATLLGPKAPHARRDRGFADLERAIAWCLKHAAETGCGAEVIYGINAGGTVVWKHKGRAKRRRRPLIEESNI